jgi:hypothetical protein
MKTKLIILMVLIALQAYLNPAQARKGHDHDTPTPTPTPTGGGGSGSNDENSHGTAIAAAAGTCVRDWTKGMQYCASWAYVDSDYSDDDGTHAFGGGVTTRVDELSLSLYGGVENIDKDNTTWLITGSINWR